MNVLVNGTTLNVKNAYAERENGMIICTVIVPQSEMDYADVKALFKGNTEDIIYTNDSEEQKIFSGFTFASILDDDANGQYIIKLTADEYAFQLGRNRELEADKASLESAVASKDMEISNLNSTVAEKDKVIAEREKTITAKDTVIEEKKVVITEQKETITALEATVAEKDVEIAELLTIAEEYADMLYAEAIEEMETVVDETVVDESEVF
ncbi:MAG: hypothetical protein IJZ25_00830 [Lachnospiraceae bacterium]|nr:hypothetical protein [Lachnospiraceae bacterium]